jgi:hypothetical protein
MQLDTQITNQPITMRAVTGGIETQVFEAGRKISALLVSIGGQRHTPKLTQPAALPNALTKTKY